MKQIAMALILMVSVLQGATIRVPQDQGTIQAGINAAVDGDTVLVGPGVYRQDLYLSKSIHLLGIQGASQTILRPVTDNVGQILGIESCEPSISGLSFVGAGYFALEAYWSRPRITDCRFDSCEGSIYLYRADSSEISNCHVLNNTNDVVLIDECDGVLIQDCVFSDNVAPLAGAIWKSAGGDLRIDGCSFLFNDGAAHFTGSGSFSIQDCVFYKNSGRSIESRADQGSINNTTLFMNENGIEFRGAIDISRTIVAASTSGAAIESTDDNWSSSVLACCNLFGNTGGDWVGYLSSQLDLNGNFAFDPNFCDLSSPQLFLRSNSPCLPTNNICGVLIGAYSEGCEACADNDFDFICDTLDNCFSIYNPYQADLDSDNIGDLCDLDLDGDNVPNSVDNCPLLFNPDQLDGDADLIGDPCDHCPVNSDSSNQDFDNDGFGDVCDNCAEFTNIQQLDIDGDSVGDDCDNCPALSNPDQEDENGDSIGDICDGKLHLYGGRLPIAIANEYYEYSFSDILGGVPPYSWMFIGGDVPPGMTISIVGGALLAGTTDHLGEYFFSLAIADSHVPPLIDTSNFIIEVKYVCGDADASIAVTISDVVYLIEFIFGAGPSPNPIQTGDVDLTGYITISDVVYLINYIFAGTAAPCEG